MGTRMGIFNMNMVMEDLRHLREAAWPPIAQERAEQIQREVDQSVARANEYWALFAPVQPILAAWREANPRARSPRWYKTLCDFYKITSQRVCVAIALFTQQAEGITTTTQLNRIAESACRMAACNHPRGEWSGSVHTIAGEYDDNLLFSCPDCGYKGS